MRESLLTEIMAVRALPMKELKEKYSELFDGERPTSTQKIYLWKRIA